MISPEFRYNANTEKLRKLRTEIEELESTITREKEQLKIDFEKWYRMMYEPSVPMTLPVHYTESQKYVDPQPQPQFTNNVKVNTMMSPRDPGSSVGFSESSKVMDPSIDTLKGSTNGSGYSLTGDSQVDEDIRTFYKIAQKLK